MNYARFERRQWHRVREYNAWIHYGWTICGKVIEGGWCIPVDNVDGKVCKQCSK